MFQTAKGLIFIIITLELVHYALLLPQPPRATRLDRALGALAYGAAYALALLRLPFSIVPYLPKLLIFLAFGSAYEAHWDSYPMQAVRAAGDVANWGLTLVLLGHLPLIQLAGMAELIRLLSEKGQMVFSALWQLLPHRRLARALYRLPLLARLPYCRYYRRSDAVRVRFILRMLKNGAAGEASDKLAYLRSLVVVPRHHGLRCADVRDVAAGTVYIHPTWTNDPWLLAGQALRRAPWMFDPRFLPRPFYYRSGSNRLATLFVLRHAWCSLPYAWYQFGHEIKAARYDTFFRLARRLGFELEETVRADGLYRFNPLMRWLGKRLGRTSTAPDIPALCSDDAVITAIVRQGEIPTAQDIASRFTYPLKYVEDVLLGKIRAAVLAEGHANAECAAAATRSGASQCG